MKHMNFDTPLEVKFLAETGVFEGYASVFNVTDSVNDRILPGAFRESLEKFHKEGRFPPLLWQHNTKEPIGIWREMHEDDHGLYVKGELFIADIPLAREALKLLKEGIVTGLSIGYRTKESHRDQKSGVRLLTQVELLEVSLVTFPANEHARVSSVKRFYGGEVLPSEREFEAFLHEAGFSRKQSKVVVAKGFRALTAENGKAAEALRALCESLRTAAEENRGATGYKSASPATAAAGLLHSLRRATLENIGAKYRSDQARSPRGNSDGGQWVDEGRGGAGGGSGRAPRSSSGGGRFGAGKLPKDPWLHEANSRNKPGHPRRPMDDMLEGGGGGRGGGSYGGGRWWNEKPTGAPAVGAGNAGRIAKPVSELSKSEAAATVEAVGARAAGKPLATHESNAKIRQAADSIEEYLGGPGRIIRNKYGDTVIMRGNKKVRFDINKTGKKPDRVTPEDPHFQFEELDEHGEWISKGDQHRYPFKKE